MVGIVFCDAVLYFRTRGGTVLWLACKRNARVEQEVLVFLGYCLLFVIFCCFVVSCFVLFFCIDFDFVFGLFCVFNWCCCPRYRVPDGVRRTSPAI